MRLSEFLLSHQIPVAFDWLKTLPNHWEVAPLKHISKVVLGKMLQSTCAPELQGIYTLEKYLKSKNVSSLQLSIDADNVDEMWFSPHEKILYRLAPGDLVMNEGGDIGKVALWIPQERDYYIQNSVQRITPFNNINSTFLQYAIFNISSRGYFGAIVNKISIAHLTKEKLSNTLIPYPSLADQEAIAAYLDRECEKIGREIELLERKADCYRHLRRSLINRAVTKIETYYKNYRLKDVFELRNGYTPSKAVPEFWEGGTIPWFRMEDIRKNGRILSDSIQHITTEAVKSAGLFEANSFILATTATIGEHAWLIADSLANQRFTNLKIRKSLSDDIDHKWMFYKFFEIDEYCKRGCYVTTFAAVDMVGLNNLQILLPPISEQKETVAYLDDKCDKIDAIIEKIETKIERLKELKRSLINEVVTGQRDIEIS